LNNRPRPTRAITKGPASAFRSVNGWWKCTMER